MQLFKFFLPRDARHESRGMNGLIKVTSTTKLFFAIK